MCIDAYKKQVKKIIDIFYIEMEKRVILVTKKNDKGEELLLENRERNELCQFRNGYGEAKFNEWKAGLDVYKSEIFSEAEEAIQAEKNYILQNC